MNIIRAVAVSSLLALTTGCATGLNSYQESELGHYRAEGLAVEEKNPAVGTALGFLPGGGSFYGRSYGLGVVNLLTWPLSVMWDPLSGYNAAESINYHATKAHVNRLRDKEMSSLDDQLTTGGIDRDRYIQKKQQIDRKYGDSL